MRNDKNSAIKIKFAFTLFEISFSKFFAFILSLISLFTINSILANENGECDGICGIRISLCNTECVANFSHLDPIDGVNLDGANCEDNCIKNIGTTQQCIKACQDERKSSAFSLEPNVFVIISLRFLYYMLG